MLPKKGKTIEWNTDGIKWVNSTINSTRDPDGFTFEDNPDRYRIKLEKVIRWQWIVKDSRYGEKPPQMTTGFYKDYADIRYAISDRYLIISKAEWTRTEFNK